MVSLTDVFRFRFAAHQIVFLCKMPTDNDIRNSLHTCPDSLTHDYDQIYNRILAQKGTAPQLALSAFRWVKFSYEPLASQTLLDAIRVKVSETGEYSNDGAIKPEIVLQVCQNFLILDKESDTFRFAHQSVEGFLETKFTEADCQTYIAETCLSLLCSPSYSQRYGQPTRTRNSQNCSKTHHLLLYSTLFWPRHFTRYEELQLHSEVLERLWKRFIVKSNYQKWKNYCCSAIECDFSELDLRKLYDCVAFQESEDHSPLVCVFGWSRRLKDLFGIPICMDEQLANVCRYGSLEIARFLLNNGADVFTACDYHPIPLRIAAENGHEAVARLLLDEGAEISPTNEDGTTPLHAASKNGHEAVVRLLLHKGADISVVDKYGTTPLHNASSEGNEEIVRILLDLGADISARSNGWMPLHCALTHKHEAVAQLLLDKGADVSTAAAFNTTPLLLASLRGCEKVVGRLLDNGADVSTTDSHRWTPLHGASQNGHQVVARLLLGKGADISAADDYGATPLRLASYHGKKAMVRLLLDMGADPELGKTAHVMTYV